jgi:hypothetical protein
MRESWAKKQPAVLPYTRSMHIARVAALLLLAAPMVAACSFRYDPATTMGYYRTEGWKLPGAADLADVAVTHIYPPPAMWGQVPGAVAQLLQHEYPYIIEFPAQEFEFNGVRKKMRRLITKATIIRWKVGEQVVAYSYNLIPLEAHRKKRKWVVKAEMGCIFPATFIDDRGDGVFRLLVQRDLTPDLLPDWAKRRINSHRV